MFGTNLKKEKRNSLTVGLLVGAAAGAAGVLMSDKKNRKKVSDKMEKVQKWSTKTVEDLKKKADKAQSSLEDKTTQLKTKSDIRAKTLKENASAEKAELKSGSKTVN